MMAEPPAQFPVSELDHHSAKVFIGVTVPLLAASLATLTARMIFKIRSQLLFALDDFLILAGAALTVVTWSLLLVAIAPDTSRTFLTIEEVGKVVEFGVLAVAPAVLSLAFIKVSVICLLLRFQQQRIAKFFLYALIGLIISSHVGFFLVNLLQCMPLAATWDTTITGAKCVSLTTFSRVSNTNTGITIATDVILSLFPITFLRQIRRPLMEKALIGVLMAMGMTAAGASVAKAVLVRQWAIAGIDGLSLGAHISMFTCIELFLGTIAACSPCFKPHIQRLLTKVGIEFRYHGSSSLSRGVHGTPAPNMVKVPKGPLQEFKTRSDITVKSHQFSFTEMEDLSQESTNVGAERLGSGSE